MTSQEVSMPTLPRPVEGAEVRASVVRGPRLVDGRHYWRGRTKGADRRTVLSGWYTRDEVLVELGRLDLVAGDPVPALRTLEDLLRAFKAHLEDDRPDLSDSTRRVHGAAARRLSETVGDVLLDEVGEATQRAHIRRRMAAGIARSTIELEIIRLCVAWRWARSVGIVGHDLRRARFKVPPTEQHTPTALEVERTLAALLPSGGGPARNRCGERLATILRVQWAVGGARVGEVAGLVASDVRLERGEVRLDGKTGPRLVKCPLAVELLEAWGLPSRPSSGLWGIRPVSVHRALGEHLGPACDRAGVPQWRSHGLRRLAADELLRAGVDIATVARIQGNSPQTLLRSYRKATDRDVARALSVVPLGRAEIPEGDVLEGPWESR